MEIVNFMNSSELEIVNIANYFQTCEILSFKGPIFSDFLQITWFTSCNKETAIHSLNALSQIPLLMVPIVV